MNASHQHRIIARLLQADAEAKERIQQAQEASRAKTMDTDVEVARLLDEARADAVRAAQSTIEQARAQAESDAQQVAQEMTARIDEMTRLAHQHLEEAVALVTAWVSGEHL